MAQQGWSFDEPTPASFWDTFPGGSPLVTGRNGLACSTGTLIKNVVASWGADAWTGVAMKFGGFSGAEIFRMGDLSTQVVGIALLTLLDGRFSVSTWSYLGGPDNSGPYYAGLSAGDWFFVEMAAINLTSTITDNGDGTSNASISFDWGVFVNGVLIANGTHSHGNAHFPNGSIPGSIGFFSLRLQGGVIVDDIYASDVQIGDSIVSYDSGLADNVITYSPPPETRITQQLLEYQEAELAETRITQMLLEVLIAGGRLGLAGHNLVAGVRGGGSRVGIAL